MKSQNKNLWPLWRGQVAVVHVRVDASASEIAEPTSETSSTQLYGIPQNYIIHTYCIYMHPYVHCTLHMLAVAYTTGLVHVYIL